MLAPVPNRRQSTPAFDFPQGECAVAGSSTQVLGKADIEAAIAIQEIKTGTAVLQAPENRQPPVKQSHDGERSAVRTSEHFSMDRAATSLQAARRGQTQRSNILASEAAIDLHIDVLAGIGPHNEDSEWADIEASIGREEHREYLAELTQQKVELSKKIEELTKGRYYLPAADQRKVADEIRHLRAQLALTVKELVLVKSHGNSKKVLFALKSSASQSWQKPRCPESEQAPVIQQHAPKAPPLLSFIQACTSHRRYHEGSRQALQLVDVEFRAVRPASSNIPYVHVDFRPVAMRGDAATLQGSESSIDRIATAKMSPCGREAALRTAMLQTEMWKMDTSTAIRRASVLRADVEKIDMQRKLVTRTIKRLEKAKLDEAIITADKKMLPRLQADIQRLDLLRKYREMLNSCFETMLMEGKEVRKVGLKKAIMDRRRREAEAAALLHASVSVQVPYLNAVSPHACATLNWTLVFCRAGEMARAARPYACKAGC